MIGAAQAGPDPEGTYTSDSGKLVTIQPLSY